MPFDFGADLGSFDFNADSFFPADVSSVIDANGDEFLSSIGIDPGSVSNFTDAPISDLNNLDAWAQTGSFAGNADWYDAFGSGVTDAAGAVEDPFEAARAAAEQNLDLVASPTELDVIKELSFTDQVKAIASQVSTDFTGFVKDAGGAFQAYQKIAPVVNVVSSALGIQNPINQVIQPIGQAVGIAGAAAGVSGAVATGNARSIVTNPAVVSTAYTLAGGGTTQLGQSIGQGVNIYNYASAVGSTLPPVQGAAGVSAPTGYTVAGALPTTVTSGAGSVSTGTGFRELNAAETAQLERNLDPVYRSSFVDTGVTQPTSYNAAVESRAVLTPLITDYTDQIAIAEQNILSNNRIAANIEAELADENLPDDRRLLLEAELEATYENTALQQNSIATNQARLNVATGQLAADQQVIATVNNNTTNSAAAEEDPYEAARLAAEQQLNTPVSDADLVRVNSTTVPGQVVDQYAMIKNIDGTYTIIDTTTGDTVQSGLTQQQAILAEQNLNIAPAGITANSNTPVNIGGIVTSITGVVPNTGAGAGTNAQALAAQLRNQQSIRSLRSAATTSQDWRVRLKLAPGANYLYKVPSSQVGILKPLQDTDGVIFPYTPAIETAYKANYNPYDLTHSNFRGYFYQGSYVDAVNVRASFTAQDTQEANYLLAVIHFFRSVTKMFYGQDAQRGSPPPLVYLSGLGDYQFAEHPCVVSQFNYTLPPDVDYIRAGTAVDDGTNFLANRVRTTIGSNPLSFAINRLLNNNLTQGAQDQRPNANGTKPPVDIPTYVPTKIEIGITLLPIQSRQQVSTQFSVQAFANGNLLRGGFW